MRREGSVDLHAHSTVSDGTLPPRDVVGLAAEAGLVAVALTDHDHLGGLAEAQAAAEAAGMEFVPGMELSVDSEWGPFHLLAYYIDARDPALTTALRNLRASRNERNPVILRKLNDLDIPITMEEVLAEAGGDPEKSVGRPHVAKVLVAKGVVASVNEAFDRYLAQGKPAYAPKERLDAREAIRLVRAAGGLPVMAHPVTVPEARRETAIRGLAPSGLAGVEVWHPKHDGKLRERLADLARELDLVATGGSDFHGANKPDVRLGTGTGDLHIPYAVVEALKARLE